MHLRLFTVPVQWRPSPIYPGLHVQTCDPRVFLQVAFTWHLPGYVLHSSISVKKEKKRKKEKKMKNESVFLFRSQETGEKKAETYCNFLVKSTRYFLNLFTLVQQVLPKACAINHSSYFATGTKHVL